MTAPRDSSPQSHAVPRPPEVLIVDDDPVVLRTLARILRAAHPEWGLSVAVTAFEAAERLRSDHCDVLVTDLDMPGTSGIDLLKHAAQRHPNITRIVHSARVYDMGGAELDQLAHVVLSKSVDTAHLIGVVEEALSSSVTGRAVGQLPRTAG